MPVLFLDSSALVKRYVRETGSPWPIQQTNPVTGHMLYVARITGVEVVSAIVRKARAGGLAAVDVANALVDFHADFSGGLSIVEVDAPVVNEAIRLAEKHGLRAYDAVQLAAALKVKVVPSATGVVPVTLVSADTDLNTAAKTEGLAVDDPNEHP